MLADVWSFVVNVVHGPVLWFTETLMAIDAVGVYLAVIVLFMIFRFFVYPLVGPAGSDTQTRNSRKRRDP